MVTVAPGAAYAAVEGAVYVRVYVPVILFSLIMPFTIILFGLLPA